DDVANKRDFIGRILTFDPTDGGARRALAVLDGRLDSADIINPERPTPVVSSETAAIHGERLSCLRCGSGRLRVLTGIDRRAPEGLEGAAADWYPSLPHRSVRPASGGLSSSTSRPARSER